MDAEDTVGIMGIGLLLTATGYIALLLPWIRQALLPQAHSQAENVPVEDPSILICSLGCILIASGIILFFMGLVLHLSVPESLIEDPDSMTMQDLAREQGAFPCEVSKEKAMMLNAVFSKSLIISQPDVLAFSTQILPKC